jgi:hypothetical protein
MYNYSQERAREWLIENDPEAAKYWATLPNTTDFVFAVQENIKDFGPEFEDEEG